MHGNDYFNKKVYILGILSTFKKLSYIPLNLAHQDASFEYLHNYIWSNKFLDRNSGKLFETQKICHHRSYEYSESLNFDGGF